MHSIRPSLPTLAVLAGTLTWLLHVSWQRWGHPGMDCGGSVDLVARVAAGEVLYRDVLSIYGPLPTYALALLMRLFGIHLNVVYAVGLVVLAVGSVLWWSIVRRFCSELETASGLIGFWVLLALQPGLFNWVLPNAFANSFGIVFTLAVIALLASDLPRPHDAKVVWASVFAAAAGLSKVECGAAAAGTVLCWTVLAPTPQRGRLRGLLLALLPGAAVTGVAVALVLTTVSWRSLLFDNLYRVRSLAGTLDVYRTLALGHAMRPGVAAVGVTLAVVSTQVVLAAAGLSMGRRSWGGRLAGLVLVIVAIGFPWLQSAAGRMLAIDWRVVGDELWWTGAAWLVVALAALAGLARGPREAGWLRHPARGTLVLTALASVLLTLRWHLQPLWPSYSAPFSPALIIVLVRSAARFARLPAADTATAVVFLGLVTLNGYRPVVLAYGQATQVVEGARGRLQARPRAVRGMAQVIAYVRAHTAPSDFVAVVPEERFINFFSERRHPTRDPGVGPHWLATPQDEARFVAEIVDRDTALLVVSRRRYPEFRAGQFMGYGGRAMQALDRDYVFVQEMDTYEFFLRRQAPPARQDPR
jgi:hypothetical protein